MSLQSAIQTIKRWKRKIPLIQVPCEMLYTARHYGMGTALDWLFWSTPRALKKMQLEPIEEDILFSIVVPLYNTNQRYLRELIEAAVNQEYTKWEICLVDASDTAQQDVEAVCREYAENDPRIRYIPVEENRGISENTNYGIRYAQGEYIVLCDHDDLLLPKALYMIAEAIHVSGAEIFYSDEDHLDKHGRHILPLYKPDWSRDLLYSQMYTCHAFCFSKAIYQQVGGFDSRMDGAQDYDLMLRFSEKTENICHIPIVLYSWRESETSTAGNADAKPYAHTAGLRALNAHLKRRYGDIAEAVETEYPFVYRTRFHTLQDNPLVSIIIPMRDHWELTKHCVDSILEKTSYQNYEIIILDNGSEQKETFDWFQEVQQGQERIRVIRADFAFNWSRLNNYGMQFASGDVYVFLNNDILIISPDWMEILCENALREDVGAVGPLLLYEDGTIQHAGIIVGMGGWADHVYKETKLSHMGSPFVSPLVNRNVMAVTGACMAVSRRTIEKIGTFDERFIICGSDVELCIRAYAYGLNNLYTPDARLYHLESKSRDSYIPEVDFTMSYNCYTPFREQGDPYYNINLDSKRVAPRESREKMDYQKIKQQLKRNRLTAGAYEKLRATVNKGMATYNVAEVQPIAPRKLEGYTKKRINLVIPSLNVENVFGGIATALKFYRQLGEAMRTDMRVIIVDAVLKENEMVEMDGFCVVSCKTDDLQPKQIVSFADRSEETIPVGENDIFMVTGWWTAYTILPVIKWQAAEYGIRTHAMLYFIQDYEPGFYPWSSRYLMADSTYKSEIPTLAVFNSKLLYDFYKKNGYQFAEEYYFEPTLNEQLKSELVQNRDRYSRKKQIVLYGRPGTARNAFELILASLNEWTQRYKKAQEWTIVSAGEAFDDITLKNGQIVRALGKVSLEEYAKLMLESKIGISLMVSPHPSYPPLEMSTFGMKVITNRYDNKDLGAFNENIISLDNCSDAALAEELKKLCEMDEGEYTPVMCGDYFEGKTQWEKIIDGLADSFQ